MSEEQEGCDLCGDWPVVVRGKCHPTAPLRVQFLDPETVVFTCYVPDCRREVWKGKLKKADDES